MGQGALLTAHVNTNQRPVWLSFDQSEGGKHPLSGSRQQHVWLRHPDTQGESWSDGAFNIFDAFKSRSMPDNTTIMILDALLSQKNFLIQFLFGRCIKYQAHNILLLPYLGSLHPPSV